LTLATLLKSVVNFNAQPIVTLCHCALEFNSFATHGAMLFDWLTDSELWCIIIAWL